jgi:hypothetical protein
MQTIPTIPQKTPTQEIIEFKFQPGSMKLVTAIVQDSARGRYAYTVDISTPWTNATTDDQDAIKAMFKYVAADALDQHNDADGVDITTTDITGEVFE